MPGGIRKIADPVGSILPGPLRLTAAVLVLLCALLLGGCAGLPENYPREESWKLDAGDTPLAQAFDTRAAARPGQSGAYPLGQGIEALAARMALARAAGLSLDVQYYIWHPDTSGRLLIKELLDAADRGIRVRLLLDDLGVGQANDEVFLLLDSHPNVSVSLFNPVASRNSRTPGPCLRSAAPEPPHAQQVDDRGQHGDGGRWQKHR